MIKPKCVIIDHRNANISSLKNAITNVYDCKLEVTSEINKIKNSDFLVLPGVGAFSDSMKDLTEKGLVEEIFYQAVDKKKPFLGICLGMQLLFESSTEGGLHEGLKLIPGQVERLNLGYSYRVPHVGWNNIIFSDPTKIFKSLGSDKNFYFVHSYYANCDKKFVIAEIDYGKRVTAAVQYDNILGFQFHPEKSQQNGMILLRDFFKGQYW